MRHIYTAFLLLVLTRGIYAQPGDSLMLDRLFRSCMTDTLAYHDLRLLCKDVGPRLSGSAGAEKAVAFAREMLLRCGADTVYLQPCRVPRWIRGEKEIAWMKTPQGAPQPLRVCALGNAVGTGPQGLTAPVVEIRRWEELSALRTGSLKGRIVFFNLPMDPAHYHTFMAYGESGIARRSGPAEAARLGALGVVVRSLASNTDDHPHTGVTQYLDSVPAIPAVALSTRDADRLSQTLALEPGLQLYFRTTCAMLGEVESYNVVGDLRGSAHPERIITVGGHLDSWDLGEGAHDDGAGCVQSAHVLALFRRLSLRPQHTLRAVMFMNEENGGRGGATYAEVAKRKGEEHLFALESDAGAFSPRGFTFEARAEQRYRLQRWASLFRPYGLYDFEGQGSGADIHLLKERGAVLSGLCPDSQRYFDVHHAETDVFEAVSPRELNLGTFAMAALLYLVDTHGL